MLHEQIKKDMQKAMKEGDKVRLQTLRSALSVFTNVLIEKNIKTDEMLDDESVLQVLKKLSKQRVEAATLFRSGGGEERAKNEDKEKKILDEYLPLELSEDEVIIVVNKIKKDLGISEKKDRGTLMKNVMQELKGKVSGNVVGKIIDESLE